MKKVWRLAIHLAMHTFLNWVVLKKCNNLWLLIAAWRGTFLPFIYLYNKLMLKILLLLLFLPLFSTHANTGNVCPLVSNILDRLELYFCVF